MEHALWTEKAFTVSATGGWITKSNDKFEAVIRVQFALSIQEADLIDFMVDARTGATGLVEDSTKLIRKSGKAVMLACNKVNTGAHERGFADFYRLGADSTFRTISAPSGCGTGEFWHALVAHLPEVQVPEESNVSKIAIIGRPMRGILR